jgi:HK97 family phage major capsid protein
LALSDRALTSEERAALALGADATGGYAVPFTLDPTVILTNDGSVNPLRQVARVESIVNKSWHGVTSAGVTVSRGAEASRVTESDPTLGGPVVTPSRVTGFVAYSDEIEEDWNALSSEVTMMLQDAKDTEEAESFVTGDGTANAGSGSEPGGLISTLSDSSLVYATSEGELALADLYDLEDALPARFRNANAVALANKTIFNKIKQLASAEAALAGDVWVRLSAGQPPELIGYSAYELSTMDSNLADGGSVLLLGDLKRGFIIVDRIGMSVELVPHLFQQQTAGSGYGLPTGQRGLLAIWRNSSKVLVDNAIRVLSTDAEPSA